MSHKATQTSGTKPTRRRTGTLLPDLPTSTSWSPQFHFPSFGPLLPGHSRLGPSSSLTLLYPRRGESRGWGRVRCLFTRCERKKRPIKFILETKGKKKTGVTEKGDGGGGVWRGLARRGSEKEKAAVPVPPLRPLRSRAAAAAAAGAGAAGEAGLGPGRAAPERRGRGAGRRGLCRPLSSPSAPPPPPPAGLGPDAVRAAELRGAPSVSRTRTGRERARSGWGRVGAGDSRARPPSWAGAARPSSLPASARRRVRLRSPLSSACRWPHPDAEARARRSLCSPSDRRLALRFLPLPFLGMGRLETEEVRPGPPPRPRWLGPPHPCTSTRPASTAA